MFLHPSQSVRNFNIYVNIKQFTKIENTREKNYELSRTEANNISKCCYADFAKYSLSFEVVYYWIYVHIKFLGTGTLKFPIDWIHVSFTVY